MLARASFHIAIFHTAFLHIIKLILNLPKMLFYEVGKTIMTLYG